MIITEVRRRELILIRVRRPLINRINHSKLLADKGNHINGIENFWNQAKRHMRKFNGIPKEQFGLFLKECEWHFNNPNPKEQLNQIKQWVRRFLI